MDLNKRELTVAIALFVGFISSLFQYKRDQGFKKVTRFVTTKGTQRITVSALYFVSTLYTTVTGTIEEGKDFNV